ncbi:MAG TPA: tripartite tricarboxylate transporter substrate-binding protein [Burkholderiales bacterium]|nr:tripartite tricarboxylate transporter substrate-binding protein [Burkholderiales bacterium]
MGLLPVALAALATLTIAGPALGQDAAKAYPARAIRVVVPFPPGGTSDILARQLGVRLTESWGQQLVVENRAGAAGAIGAETAARAQPDGYTLLLTDVGSLLIAQLLSPKPAFDLVRDFAPITLVSYSPHLVCVHPSVPASDVSGLIRLAKARPGALNFASSPAGAPYMAGLMFSHRTGVRWTYITGRGGSQSVLDVASGQADVLFNGMLATLPYVKNGRLKLLAVSSERRVETLPDIPTVAESVPGFVTGSWQGLLAPVGTPPEIVAKFHAALARVLGLPDVREKLRVQGADPLGNTPPEAARFLQDERDRWARLIQETGYKPM